MPNKPMTVTSREVTLRDFGIFQLKLAVDGTKDFVAFWLSIGAIILDFIAGRGRRPRLFYSVVRASDRFDKWIDLHSVVHRMDAQADEDDVSGGDDSVDDPLIGQIEALTRGGEKLTRQMGAKLRELAEEAEDSEKS
jgi:hypothetical protein